MAGVPGFEPGNAGIKTLCLTAWRHPNIATLRRSAFKAILFHYYRRVILENCAYRYFP